MICKYSDRKHRQHDDYMGRMEFESGEDYFDSKAFKQYAATIEAVILLTDGITTHADLKKAMGDAFRAEWVLDAIASLDTVEAAWSYRMAWQPKKFRFVFRNDAYNTPEAVTVHREAV